MAHECPGHIDGLVQERRNSIANALELRLSCTNPSICGILQVCPTMAVWSIWNLLTVMYLACQQWQCRADVCHVSVLAQRTADKEDRFAAVPMALEQYLKDHASDTILSKDMFK